eukprot:TRINITY_DN1806_c0_g1_i2.p1 TRINITY_DN1806_c0_g1~~TRINITY_DN1806_c0_g1_i2.p1  ORF type:complete len:235 (-),score=44.40 TRINITY_DN1806_c0_g1_i2:72-776(-)
MSVGASYIAVAERVAQLAQRLQLSHQPRLVAVSKTKPAELLQQVYDAGCRHFGENYVQELVEKAPTLPSDIEWHFIGHLQSNKVKTVLSVPNLAVIESVHSIKLANMIQQELVKINRSSLKVFIQVNTSLEESKSGVEEVDVIPLAKHIVSSCPNVKLAGLMTIGAPTAGSRPDDFLKLSEFRERIARELNLSPSELELSMGMSADFELAIEHGSTNVRVGSTIFGERSYPAKA